MAGRASLELEELLLRLIADGATLHALLQEANDAQFAQVRKRLEVFLAIVSTLPKQPGEHARGIGFVLEPVEAKKNTDL